MSRRFGLCLVALAALVVAPAVRADGPSTGGVLNNAIVIAANGSGYYFVTSAGAQTALEVQTSRGLTRTSMLPGAWGIPTVTMRGDADGLSRNGKTLVLARNGMSSPSTFLIVNTRTLKATKRVVLKGYFAFDALSPDGSLLYLIQHTSINDLTHYVVRAYDLRSDRLLPYRIADKTQQNWVMQGYAMTRATGPGGRWVYTLYQNPGGYPFIHALDTVNSVAHCIGLPWTGDQSKLWNVMLTVGIGGKALSVSWRSGKPWLAVNTANWDITHVAAAARPSTPPRTGGFPWRWFLGAAAGVIILALGFAAALRANRSRRFRVGRAPA
ncbi:MAG: hypothetical protein QOE91_903 [Gaiellaceae bacterium]|nr:hypothetical protein [Gaiellaceae bacterium]